MERKPFTVKAQGGSACVTEPALECVDAEQGSHNPDLSKIQPIENANKEYKESLIIDRIDTDENYHMKLLRLCKPKIADDEFKELKNKCDLLQEFRGSSHDLAIRSMLLQMRDGGMPWHTFSEINNLTLEDVKDFLINSYNVVRGIEDMLEKDFIHGDVKTANILYNTRTKRSNIIDFGMSGISDTIKQDRKKGIISQSSKGSNSFYWHQYDAPDKLFQFKNIFIESKRINFNSSENFKEYFKQDGWGFQIYRGKFETFEFEENKIDNEFYQLTEQVKKMNYERFLETTLKVLDVFGMAFSLIEVTFNFTNILRKINSDSQEYNEISALNSSIRKLAIGAANINPQKRPTPQKFAQEYERCIIRSLSPPLLAYYEFLIICLYPKETFLDYNEFSWVNVSKIISEHESVLKLDLLEFIKSMNDYPNNTLTTFRDNMNFVEKIPLSEGSLKIRAPQKESNLLKNKDLNYLNLLGSQYCIYIAKVDDKAPIDSINTPKILFDAKNESMYIYMTRNINDTPIFIPLKTQQINSPNGNVRRLNIETENALMKYCNASYAIFEVSLVLEIVCLTLVELYVPNKIAAKIVRIICDTSTLDNHVNVTEFERILIKIVQDVQSIDKSTLLKVYKTRYHMSLLRGAIADSGSARLKQFRKIFGQEETPAIIGHRNHAKVAAINAIMQNHWQTNGMPLNYGIVASQVTNKIISYYINFDKLLQEMVKGMIPTDKAFKYRGFDISVKNVLDLAKSSTNNNSNIYPIKNVQDTYFCEDVVDRINKFSKKKTVKVYTQLQVDAMVLMPGKFQNEEYKKLYNHINQQGNVAYVIFEDKSPSAHNKNSGFLVHGFKLRNQTSDFKSTELVVLVPKACVFKVMEPVTWRFLNKLLDIIGANSRVADDLPIIKEQNYKLSKYFYGDNLNKIYVTREESLIQVELIANNQVKMNLTPEVRANWTRLQYLYIYQKMFM